NAKWRVNVEGLGFINAITRTGGGVPDLSQAGIPRQGTHVARAEYVAHQAMCLVHAEKLIVRRGDAGSILATVLQEQQTVIDQLIDGGGRRNPHDSTHFDVPVMTSDRLR